MNRIKMIDGFPCVELPEGILQDQIELEISEKFSSIQSLKELESKRDLLKELKEKFKNFK